MASINRSPIASALASSPWSDSLRCAVRVALRQRSVVSATLVAATLAGPGAPALAESFPAEFELSSLAGGDGVAGFVLNGIDSGDYSGFQVSAAGDVNGDGVGDLIVGASNADPGGDSDAGESYVVFGRAAGTAFPSEFELSSLQAANGGDGSTGFVLNGVDLIDYSGRSVSTAGDVNGDGIEDLIVGAYWADPGSPIRFYAGESYVVFGRAAGTAFPAEFELSSLQAANGGDGSTGFVLNGSDSYDASGRSVSAAGDVNGDGIGDLIVGAASARSYAGESYVVFGRAAGTAFPAEIELSSLQVANGGDGSIGFVLNGIDTRDASGRWVSAAGDVNGDAIGDLIVGAYGADPAGESYLVFGRASGTAFPAEFELSSLQAANGGDGNAGFVLNGIDVGDATPASDQSVSAAGDVNGDGIGDLIVGADRADPGGRIGAGESYVVFGRAAGTAFPAEFELSSLQAANGGNGSVGFVLNGIDADDRSGRVSAAGDVNGDGIGDLIVSARFADPGGRDNAGESYVVFGRTAGTAFPAEFELSSLQAANGGNGSVGFVLNGIDADDRSGFSVSAAGDMNGDGIGDLIVGAVLADPGGRIGAGQVYVVFGRADTDADGVSDDIDNCTLAENPGQRDTDADGVGNFCDPDVAAPNDCIVNFLDLNVYRANFFQAGDLDTDNNGDGQTNFLDLNIVRSYFFGPPGPSATGCN